MNYSSQHLQAIFKISHQTVQNWCRSFDAFLSPSARPEKKKQRVFVDDDISVFALAHEMLGQGKNYEDVKAALASGSRGQLPETSVELMPGHVSGQVLALRESLSAAHNEIKRLQTALDEQRGRDKLLDEKLQAAEAEIKALNREIGRLEAK